MGTVSHQNFAKIFFFANGMSVWFILQTLQVREINFNTLTWKQSFSVSYVCFVSLWWQLTNWGGTTFINGILLAGYGLI
jgi:hypothetical protein